MKTLNLILVTGLILTLSTNLFAKGDNDPSSAVSFDAAIQVTQNDAVIFRCTNNIYDKINVKVYDESCDLLHSKFVKTKGNIKLTYSISELPEGEFTIKVFNKTKLVYSQKFNKNRDNEIVITLD